MINHIILLVFLILLTEAINFFKIKYVIFNLFKNTKNLPRIFKNSNSDEKFEVIYFKTAKSILFDSIKILSFLFVVILFFYFFYKINESFFLYLISFAGIAETLFLMFVYFKIRKFYANKL